MNRTAVTVKLLPHEYGVELCHHGEGVVVDREDAAEVEAAFLEVTNHRGVVRHPMVQGLNGSLSLKNSDVSQCFSRPLDYLDVEPLRVHLQVNTLAANLSLDGGEHFVKGMDGYGDRTDDCVSGSHGRCEAMVRCEEGIAPGGLHEVQGQGAGLTSKGVWMYVPASIGLRSFCDLRDQGWVGLKGHQRSLEADAVADEISELSAIGSHVKNAVDIGVAKELLEVVDEVVDVRPPLRHDDVSEGLRDARGDLSQHGSGISDARKSIIG